MFFNYFRRTFFHTDKTSHTFSVVKNRQIIYKFYGIFGAAFFTYPTAYTTVRANTSYVLAFAVVGAGNLDRRGFGYSYYKVFGTVIYTCSA